MLVRCIVYLSQMFHWSCLFDTLSVCRRCFIKYLFHSRWTYLFSFQVIFCKLYLVLWLPVNTIRSFYFFFYVSYIWTYYFIQHQMTYFKSPAYHLQEKKLFWNFVIVAGQQPPTLLKTTSVADSFMQILRGFSGQLFC